MGNLELEAMRKEVELRYNVTLEKGDPLLAVMAVTVQIVSECLESMRDQNFVNHKVVMNELQKIQATMKLSTHEDRRRVSRTQNIGVGG